MLGCPATLSLDQFRAAWQSGEFNRVGVTGSGGLFFVTGQRGGDKVTLATTRGKAVRGFRDAGKAIAVLHGMGARHIDVDKSNWTPDQVGSEGKRRPDTALRQQRAHAAAAHDSWFRAEVLRSLEEADASDANWIAHDDVKHAGTARRAVWVNRVEAGRKPG
ncbi:hypothetical protein [Beijerinckia sp. L45]|uniref:hypothetical protein n=1 Tax=Beijerinckia sp. L45 TaxID=1641855 RepID=UPI00131E8B91|nr:hypothetical protein [Beijerinckia sp. L45]